MSDEFERLRIARDSFKDLARENAIAADRLAKENDTLRARATAAEAERDEARVREETLRGASLDAEHWAERATAAEATLREKEADIAAFRASQKDGAEASGWRPISEAPTDGTSFLATHEKSGVRQITSYGKTSHVPLYGWTVCPDGDPEEIDLWQPTHWMPLPAPPTASQETGKGGGDVR